MLEQNLKWLGLRVRDLVTGFEGVVESISFDLYGCVQAIVKPGLDPAKPWDIPDGRWFDLKRLSQVGNEPVMAQPTFAAVPGGCEKPSQPSTPIR